MKTRLIIAALLALIFSMSASAEDIAVRINDETFTVEQVQKYADETARNIRLTTGRSIAEIYDDSSRDEFLTDAAEHFVTGAISDAKLREIGKYELSDEEINELREYAQTNYDTIWEQLNERVKEAYPDAGDMEAYVTQVIESAGYSMDGIFESGARDIRQQRLIDAFCGDIALTDEDVEAFYAENYVAADREKYENDLNLFEAEVILAGASSAYVPDGYFYIKYITMKPNEDSLGEVTKAQSAYAECSNAKEAVYQELALAAANEEPLTDLQAKYREACSAEEQAGAMLEEALAQIEADYLPILEAVKKDMEAGASFEDEMAKHSIDSEMGDPEDKGFPYHPDSMLWDERLSARTAELENEGDLAGPVYTSGKIVIVCRMEDMPSGAYPLSGEEKDALTEGLLAEKQLERLNELIGEWRKDFDVEIDITGLVFPED